jgi:hypothetical protein
MEKWKDWQLNNYLYDERMNCYYFWFKGKITRKRNGHGEIYEQNLTGKCEWNGIRFKNGFNTIFNIFVIKYTMGGRWNGQSKAEYDKNYKRVSDIVTKSDGDKDKQERLAKTQANKITDEFKAINRAMAAKDMGHENLFEVFFQRAYELGSVSKQEYREYQMEKLGI